MLYKEKGEMLSCQDCHMETQEINNEEVNIEATKVRESKHECNERVINI